MANCAELLKELRLFLALFITTGGISLFNGELAMEYVYTYNIHLAVITIMGIYVNHFLSNRRHKQAEVRLDFHQEQLNGVILENSIGQLKAEVRQAFKDYHKIEIIDFVTTIKYLRGLDERRVGLGVNSYTEDMMHILLNKIQLGVE